MYVLLAVEEGSLQKQRRRQAERASFSQGRSGTKQREEQDALRVRCSLRGPTAPKYFHSIVPKKDDDTEKKWKTQFIEPTLSQVEHAYSHIVRGSPSQPLPSSRLSLT
mmetsp:Transcript_35830/g.70549  ORF Transcript_35830/g.70549 Transcript_35830/m.70549 type:complete len:108 (+) Transcript_35830:477-800(+)